LQVFDHHVGWRRGPEVLRVRWRGQDLFAGTEQFAVENAYQPALPVGGAPAKMLHEQLVAVTVHQFEEAGHTLAGAPGCGWPPANQRRFNPVAGQ
jgi:hypothetical protein